MWHLDWKKIVCWLNDLILLDTCWVPLIGVIASMILGCSKLRKSIASAARQSRWSHAVGALWQLERQARSMLFMWKISKQQCWRLPIRKNRSISTWNKPGAVEEVEVDSILFTAALSACATRLHVLLERPRNVEECLMAVGAQIFVNVYVSWFQNTLSVLRNPLGEYRQWSLRSFQRAKERSQQWSTALNLVTWLKPC